MPKPLFRRALAVLAGLAVTGGLAGSAAGAAESHRTRFLDITATDFSYQMPPMGPVQAGLTTLRLHNGGTQPHQANIARLHDGVTYDRFTAALQQGLGPALALIDFAGGVNTIDPGATGVSFSDLQAGNYVLLCFVSGADGVPHVAKGMIMPFQVAGTDRGRRPHTTGTVGLRNYAITLPARFGHGVYAATNTGDEPHEVALLRIAPGKTVDDVMHFLDATSPPGPPPFSDAGGIGAIAPGATAYGRIHLKPGNYVALCFVPDDQAPHQPHFMKGMFQPFSVS